MDDYNTTIPALYFRRVDENAGATALLIKRDGEYQSVTWNDLHRDVLRSAAALVKLGVSPGDRVVQCSENCYEWIVADLAIQIALGVHVPVHAPLSGEQIAWQVRDSGAKVVLFSTRAQAEKCVAATGQLPAGVQCFGYDEFELDASGFSVTAWRNALAAVEDDECAGLQQQCEQAVTPESLATILYTSGTTGQPKGVMLTQRNLVSNALGTLSQFEYQPGDVRLNFLPLSHIFARTCDLYTWIAGEGTLALAENRDTILADCQAVRPTQISGVPYFYDRVYSGLRDAGMLETPGVVVQALGGQIRLLNSGGAALPDYLFDFFQQQQLPIYQGYGLTESSPVITVSSTSACKNGSVGRPIPGVEIRIADDGEILTRGPHVMRGYWNDQQATDTVIHDGWLFTGDLGRVDDDGFLFITGRKKEIIVTAAGKNVAPVLLESLLTEDPLILQALVIGDDRSFLTALVVPDPDNLRAAIIQRKIPVTSKETALSHEAVRALYADCIADRLKSVSHHEQVRNFALLGRGFTIESGEMTPKLSLRRDVIGQNFAAEIEAMYRRE